MIYAETELCIYCTEGHISILDADIPIRKPRYSTKESALDVTVEELSKDIPLLCSNLVVIGAEDGRDAPRRIGRTIASISHTKRYKVYASKGTHEEWGTFATYACALRTLLAGKTVELRICEFGWAGQENLSAITRSANWRYSKSGAVVRWIL